MLAGMILSSLLFSSVWKVRRNIGVSYAGLFGMGFGAALCGVLPPCYGGWFVFALGCALLGGRQCPSCPVDGLHPEECGSRENGQGVLCTDPGFIGNHASGAAHQQSNRGNGRRGSVVSALRHCHNGFSGGCVLLDSWKKGRKRYDSYATAPGYRACHAALAGGNLDTHAFCARNYWCEKVSMVRELLLQAAESMYMNKTVRYRALWDCRGYDCRDFCGSAAPLRGLGKQLLDHVKHLHPVLLLSVYRKNLSAAAFITGRDFLR